MQMKHEQRRKRDDKREDNSRISLQKMYTCGTQGGWKWKSFISPSSRVENTLHADWPAYLAKQIPQDMAMQVFYSLEANGDVRGTVQP